MQHPVRRLAALAAGLLAASAARGVELRPGDIVAMDAHNARERLLRIDPETGARQLIAAMGAVTGGLKVAIDARDQILLTVSASLGGGFQEGVVQVDPATGASRLVTSGGLLRRPLGIVVEADGHIVVSDGPAETQPLGSIVRIDPVTGAQTLVSGGGELFAPWGLSLLPDGDFLAAGTAFAGSPRVLRGFVLRVDSTTGAQQLLAKPTLSFPLDAVATPDGEAYLSTIFPGLVTRVDLATGEETLVADIGSNVNSMALEPRGTLVVAVDTIGSTQILRVDPRTGATENVGRSFPAFVLGLAVVPFRVLEVAIDVRPASASNPINPDAPGIVPVALLGSEELDVGTIDPASLAFGPDGAPPARAGTLGDLNGDGLPDLLLHFRIPATGIQAGDTEACLTGSSFEGRRIEGCDAIRTVGWRARWSAAWR